MLAFGRKLGPWSYSEDYNAPYAALIEATAATILIATIALNAKCGYFSGLRSKWLIWLGDISYGMYLLHVPVFTSVAGICGDVLKIRVFQHRSNCINHHSDCNDLDHNGLLVSAHLQVC